MSMRGWLLAAAAALAACPLVIEERCETSEQCPSNAVCQKGSCVAVDGRKVGERCTVDADCGPGLQCATGFPGGYCVADCSSSLRCPEPSICIEPLSRCFRPCGESCTREGYGCVAVPQPGSRTQACAPTGGPGDGGGADANSPDAGCVADRPLDQGCTHSCQCAHAGAVCDGGVCQLLCDSDFQCPAGRRCEQAACLVGKRLGDRCASSFECPSSSFCDSTFRRCQQFCASDSSCPRGYRCAPDGYCVEDCSETPATLGLTCQSSMDCPRCGFCVSDGQALRCHKPCLLDRDCDGGLDSCADFGSYRICRL